MDNYTSNIKVTRSSKKEVRSITMGSTRDINKPSSNSSTKINTNSNTNLADMTAKILQKQYKR